MRPQFIESRDGVKLRVGVWDASSAVRGVCVLLHGQSEFLEKYDEVAGELNARGFVVAALDWRGHGASARLLDDALKAHVGDFKDYDSDLAAFMEKVVRPLGDARPLALAHSMGGHILLRALHDHPDWFRGSVITAPMIGVLTGGYPPFVARAICFAHYAGLRSGDWVWGMAERDPLKLSFDDNMVTSDRGRFTRNTSLIAQQPQLRLAGPSWGWLEAAYRSMSRVTTKGYAEAIATPTLIVGAGKDRIVDTKATRKFAARLPHGKYLEFTDAEHEILMENDAIRARFWRAFDAFVDSLSMPGKAETAAAS